jgi:hypothetical protein
MDTNEGRLCACLFAITSWFKPDPRSASLAKIGYRCCRPNLCVYSPAPLYNAGENRPLRLGRLAGDRLFDDAHDQHEHSTAYATARDLFDD